MQTMSAKLQVHIANDERKKVMVVGHERSGTHFLMNTLALNFGYVARPWINFDFDLGINFHAPQAVRDFFVQMHGKPVLNIVKSHHPYGFFSEVIDEIHDEFHVFYILRDPRDVMVSYWRCIRELPWDEGPRADTVGEFMRAAPRGAVMRYQKEQVPNMLARWKAHVDSWIHDAPTIVRNNLIVIRYEDLNSNYRLVVSRIGEHLGIHCATPVRPNTTDNVVLPGKGEIGGHRQYFTADDHAFVQDVAGETIQSLELVR